MRESKRSPHRVAALSAVLTMCTAVLERLYFGRR
jgi:hypothetical protein